MPMFPYQGQPVTILGGGPLAGPYVGQPVVPVDQFGNPIAFSSNYLTLPAGWDTVWRTAKSNAKTTPAWINVVDDSVLSGANASTDWNLNGAFGQLRTALLAQGFANYGDFYSISQSVDYSPGFLNPPWVVNDTANRSKSYSGYAGTITWGVGMANPAATFVTPYACTAFDILWQNPFAAANTTWVYTIDGGANQTVTDPASSNNYPIRTSVTGLANTTHTIRFTTQSAANAMTIYGIATYPTTPASAVGLGFANCSFAGQMAADFVNNLGNQPRQRYQLWQGPISAVTLTGFGFPAAASAYIIALGLNDCSNLIGSDIVETSLIYQIRAMRRAVQNCSILIMADSNPDGITSDVTSGLLTNPASWGNYKRVLQSVAATFNCAYLDIDTKWGSTGVAQGFQLATNIHPIQGGHNDIATLFKSIF